MKQVGVDYTKESATAMRRLAFFISPLAVVYIVLASMGLVPSSGIMTPVFAGLFSVFWMAASVYYYVFPSDSKAQKLARTVMYHILAGITIVSVIGFANPLAALYVLLFVTTYTYYGKRGFAVSTLFLALLGLLDIYIQSVAGNQVLVANSITFLSISIMGVSLVGIMSTQETRRKTLLHSKRQAQLQRERLTTIINNLSDATFSVSQTGVISMYNAACLSLLDINANIKGRKITEVLNLVTVDNEAVSIGSLLKDATRTITRDDLMHQYTDGESVRLEITYAPIRGNYSVSRRDEERGGYVIIMRDITKQKSLEEERDEFISVVSHELRTPITIAEGTVSNLALLMDRGIKNVDEAMLSKTVETAHEQIIYLARMVNDLSTLSRAERGVADDAESIDVNELVQMLFHKYESEAKAHGLQLNLDLGTSLGSVHTSKLYLEELLQNFITNAIKYTHEGSVTVIAKKNDKSIHFAVTDTGIGMSRTDQAGAFKKFYRSEDYRIRETSGTGLGLYVAAKLAQKIGTKIDLKSRVNFGSTFSFDLPREDK